MASEADLVAVLQSALRAPDELVQRVAEFQRLVWDRAPDDAGLGVDATEIFVTLAYDLDFFVPDPRDRAEDASYFGPERARSEIEAALAALAKARNG